MEAAAAYAQKYGGGSGCIVRHGYLVKEWGSRTSLADIKSASKGAFGTTALGLAVDKGLVALDDPAQKHYPGFGTESQENVARGWLDEITLRHLATMTAGFDDGRPPKLVYRPGTTGLYSNDTANMLAELLTLKFKEDLASVARREVLEPIGIVPSEWAWRENQFRPKTIASLKSREFASGITITHRALARIGYLYLREGQWKERRILSREFIRTATGPTTLPAPWPYYAFYWGSNARETFAAMPRDAFWALGLGDSFVVVCPSLDIVAVRLGAGSTKSQLPGGDDWGRRVEGFFGLVVQAVRDPYPASPLIRGVRWEPSDDIVRVAKGSDNWPLTWADDDQLYTAYGDGKGFDPPVPDKLSLGFARVSGAPPNFAGVNIRSSSGEQRGDGPAGKKASSLLMVDGVLYLCVRNAANSQLAWSSDHGKTWSWSMWKFETSFGCPTFLNFARDYAGARDRHVYVYSPDSAGAYGAANGMVLARVPLNSIKDRCAYEFFQGLDSEQRPSWSKDINMRGHVFKNPGRCCRSSVSYDAGLKRYLLCQTFSDEDARFQGGIGIYDAPEPWGPWTTVYFTDLWDIGPGETASLPSKWMSANGRSLYLVFSGNDAFSVRKLTFDVAAAEKRP